MSKVELVVIGASAGGLDGLLTIVKELPPSLPATLLIVMHTNSSGTTYLPDILGRVSRLPVKFAADGQKVGHGQILVAPPDFHVLVSRGKLSLTRGPRENGFRPAIDPLFRTASRIYRKRLMGVILSGALDDGSYGMKVIKEHGGITVVQDPEEAPIPSMPLSVLASMQVDHVLTASEIAKIIDQFATRERTTKAGVMKDRKEPEPQNRNSVTQVEEMKDTFGPPSALTCPDCGGALWEVADKGLLRFRCHVGHQFTGDALDTAQHDAVEGALWTAVRALEEQAAMKHRMAERALGAGLAMVREGFLASAKDSHRQAEAIRGLLFSRKTTDPSDAVLARAMSGRKRRLTRAKSRKSTARRVA
jgi:two-component system, chemotaxis family, protein-glutamate methylesterase/glutaminase